MQIIYKISITNNGFYITGTKKVLCDYYIPETRYLNASRNKTVTEKNFGDPTFFLNIGL